jgi:hypothetical protein
MTWTLISVSAIAVAALGYCGRLYLELWRWARQCQHARIAVSYKGKVQLQAPILEWILWANQLDLDKDSNGRVVWRSDKTAVAIAKKVVPPNRLQLAIQHWKRRKEPAAVAPVQEARISTVNDTDPAEMRRQRRLANQPGRNNVKAKSSVSE